MVRRYYTRTPQEERTHCPNAAVLIDSSIRLFLVNTLDADLAALLYKLADPMPANSYVLGSCGTASSSLSQLIRRYRPRRPDLCRYLISEQAEFTHTNCSASRPRTLECATYSASVEDSDSATETFLLELQVMAPLLARRTLAYYPLINLRLSAGGVLILVEASTYPRKRLGCWGSALYTMLWCLVHEKYCRMHFSAPPCWRLGLAFVSLIVVANSNMSSNQTVTIANSSRTRQMYAHGSDLRRA